MNLYYGVICLPMFSFEMMIFVIELGIPNTAEAWAEVRKKPVELKP
jgi:hypothetical protein